MLVNNAGIVGSYGRVEDLDASVLARLWAVNVTGPFVCAREAIRRMATDRGGSGGAIVNVSSRAAALGGSGEWVHYAASKGAIDTMTVGLAREVAAQGFDDCIDTAGEPIERLTRALRKQPALVIVDGDKRRRVDHFEEFGPGEERKALSGIEDEGNVGISELLDMRAHTFAAVRRDDAKLDAGDIADAILMR